MPHQQLLDPKKTILAVIDHQESFREMIGDFDAIAQAISRIVRGFLLLDLPLVVTEQYPKGLGHTAREIVEVLPEGHEIVEKTAFSSCGEGLFLERIREADSREVVVCGIETHICVNQTVHDLLDEGFAVHVLTDAVGSRSVLNRDTALEKMFSAGAVPSSVEMALFELMRDAKHPRFRKVQALII